MTRSATNERFDAWLASGGDRGKLWDYMAFISRAKVFAYENGLGVYPRKDGSLAVRDHSAFTAACWALSIKEGGR